MKNRKRIIILVVVIIIALGLGVKKYMDDKKESIRIQRDLANYIYKNYEFYRYDKKREKLIEEYHGSGNMSDEEFYKKSRKLKIYEDITKIEFTRLAIGPMNSLEIYFTINDKTKNRASIMSLNVDTNEFEYYIREDLERKKIYYLKEEVGRINKEFPEQDIVYYTGGIK